MCSLSKPPTPWVHVFSKIYLLPPTMVLHPPPVYNQDPLLFMGINKKAASPVECHVTNF